jgi:uncharacterized membrane protein YidH (DUF202 family)
MRLSARSRTILLWVIVALAVLVAAARFARFYFQIAGHHHLG